MAWWNDEIMTISAVQCKYHETSDEIFNDYVKKSNFNTEQLLHISADGHMALYDEDIHGKLLDEYLKKSRKAGVKEIIYLNIHAVTEEAFKKHPEYANYNRNNENILLYNVHHCICINGPYFDDYIKSIKDLCRHDIDGIFLDGPIVRPDACFCEHCLKEFEEMYGYSKYDAEYFVNAEFNHYIADKFVKATRDAIKEINPDILLYLNNIVLKPDLVGSRTRMVEKYVDIIGVEGGFVWVDKATTPWHVSPMVKMAETIAHGKPTVCFIAGDHKPWSYYMHTPSETDILYAQTIAYGANVWYGLHGNSKQGETPGGKAATEFNRFILDNSEYLINTSPCSKVALYWSDTTARRYSSTVDETDFIKGQEIVTGDKRGNQSLSFRGMYDILTRCHVQFDIIDEVSLKKGELSKYELFIMPIASCISDELGDIIRAYVKNGGQIISNFDVGMYDELCNKRDNSVISDVLGIEKFTDIVEYAVGCGYLKNNKESKIFDNVSDDNIPHPLLSAKTVCTETAEVIAEARMPLAGRYVDIVEESYPGIILNKYGKGMSVYFSGTVGEFFDKYANTDWRKIIENTVYGMSTPEIVTNAPGSVEVSLRKKEGKYIIHLINVTGEMTRPIEKIIPIHNVKLSLKSTPAVKSVKTLRSKEQLSFEIKNEIAEINLPILNNHEIIVVER